MVGGMCLLFSVLGLHLVQTHAGLYLLSQFLWVYKCFGLYDLEDLVFFVCLLFLCVCVRPPSSLALKLFSPTLLLGSLVLDRGGIWFQTGWVFPRSFNLSVKPVCFCVSSHLLQEEGFPFGYMVSQCSLSSRAKISACLCFLSTGIKGMLHHIWLGGSFQWYLKKHNLVLLVLSYCILFDYYPLEACLFSNERQRWIQMEREVGRNWEEQRG